MDLRPAIAVIEKRKKKTKHVGQQDDSASKWTCCVA